MKGATSLITPADGSKPVGLRERITDLIVVRITSGEWAPGDTIPSESALSAQFGASRMTVHHALRDLTSRGFLVRRKGSGTFVAPPRPYASRYAHLDIVDEVQMRGNVHTARVIARGIRAASRQDIAQFGFGTGDLFHAVVLHSENGRPLELEDRLIDPKILPECLQIDLTRRSLFSVLMLIRPYREGSEQIGAVTCTDAEAELLGVAAGTPALAIERRTWTAYGMVTAARMLRAGATAVLRGTIAPDGGVATSRDMLP